MVQKSILKKGIWFANLIFFNCIFLFMHYLKFSVLMPIDNYLESYSTKIFEYMDIGLPVITSNFELYKNVIEKHETGFCIDPTSYEALAGAMLKFADNPQLIVEMGNYLRVSDC